MNLRYVEGDLFAPLDTEIAAAAKSKKKHVIYIPHVCNCKGGWGSGFVVPLGTKFPMAKQKYLGMGVNESNLGYTQSVTVTETQPTVVICNMIAQTLGGVRPLYYNHLAACMEQVAHNVSVQMNALTKPKTTCEIRCPMFGAGLAGGDWNFIEMLIEDTWVKRGINVSVYWLAQFVPDNWANKHRLNPTA